jgi:DNA mismatch repair protein MSH6
MSQQRNLLSFFAKRPAAAPAADDAEGPAPKRAAHATADERPTPSRPAVARDEAQRAGAPVEPAPPCASPAEPPATAEQSAARRAKAQRLLGAGAAPKANAAEAKIEARFAFLADGAVRDAERRAPSHPQFDARTLYVPPSVKLSPAQQAYWDVKKLYGAQCFQRLLSAPLS